ncbi:SRPBCC family protein [Siculibacillus lacustris]|uniref:SRPBCC family protein n=1 Tax=Siculibacillus lacustris TaxID=1549641 RepID=A0A4Q9VIM9_9HYPH|nr:SRPBCC family protein [Siculibacillus lacustris]TBW35113.1 SRPBCC family protein [Siculibacillus lacustris]
MTTPSPTHVDRRYDFVLARPIAAVFPLFTPRGEEAWVPGWDPEYLHPIDGTIGEGLVFRTGIGGECTLWACVAWHPEDHRVRYARVSPDSRFAFVEVACRALDAATTQVTVAYAITALNAAGEAVIAATTPEVFAATIDGWRQRIETAWAAETAGTAA